MRGPGDIVLVSCYELGHAPHGLTSPLAFLRRAGYAPTCLDLSIQPLDDEALGALGRARLVAISVPMHTALRLGVRAAARLRAVNPAAHLCFHGLYAPLNEAWLRSAAGADSVLGGESEPALVAIADALAEGTAVPAGPSVRLERLEFPPPDREGLPPPGRYARLVVVADDGAVESRPTGYLEATRGCKHTCRHCPISPIYRGRFFVVPREVVLEDARRQVAAGARHLTFGDPDFLNGPRHALEVVRALHREHPAVTFDVTVKVEHILANRMLFAELRSLGCVFVVSAFESLSDPILALLDKGHTRADLDEALAVVRLAGISLRPTFVPFTPWTTLDDVRDLCGFIERHALEDEVDPVQLSLALLIPPGSLLLERPELQPHLGALDDEAFTYTWRYEDPRVASLQREIAALVERATREGAPARQTFAAIAELMGARPAKSLVPPRRGSPPPRLSEPWFC